MSSQRQPDGPTEGAQLTDAARFQHFGPFRLDRRERLLFRGPEAISLPPKAIELLLFLLEEPGRMRSKDELMARVWPDVAVEESNLTQNIFLLRKALEEEGARWIVTVPRRGYRFAGTVTTSDAATLEPDASPASAPLVASLPSAGASSKGRRNAAIAIAVLFASVIIVLLVSRARHVTEKGDSIRSIAVLPFRALDGRSGDRALEIGIADSLITKLSALPELRVAPLRAVTDAADHPADPLATGRLLAVDAVLEGSIQREAGRIRCTVRLLRVDDGHAIWSSRYDDEAVDRFELEDRLAQRVADAVDLRLTRRAREALAKRYTANLEAYQLYQQGRFQWNTFSTAGLLSSIHYYEAALKIDPHFALAYAGLAGSYSVIGIYGPMPAVEAFRRAREAALRALALDPELANAHNALAATDVFFTHDWREANEELRRTSALNPSEAHTIHAYLLQAFGRPLEAAAELREVRALDPTWEVGQNDVVKALYLARRYDEAIAEGRQLIALRPEDRVAQDYTGRAMLQRGLIDMAVAHETAILAASPKNVRAITTLGVIAGRRGDVATVNRQIVALQAVPRADTRAFNLARVYANSGNADAAFAALREALVAHAPFIYEISVDPEFDPIRKDSRFNHLLSEIGLPAQPQTPHL